MNAIYYDNWDASYIPNIFKEIYLEGVYHPFLMGRKNLTIIDAGANIGLWSMYASQYAKTIYAIEPSKATQKILKKNLSQPAYKKTEILFVPKAITNERGSKTFYTNPSNTTANTLIGGNPDNSETVECITIADLFKEYKIDHVDFLKLDVEGSEFEILGGNAFKEVAPKIDTIVGEMHSWVHRNYNQIKDALEMNGYDVTFFKRDASLFSAIRKD